ncbi:MAG: hypothetical protein QF368_01795 [SAR202 cluster bacterium]|nr:hypothetical protein [SAR202 cluster bacterium]
MLVNFRYYMGRMLSNLLYCTGRLLHNIRNFIVWLVGATFNLAIDIGYWIADLSVGLWAIAFDLTSAGMNRLDKWIRPPTISIVFEDRWMRVLVVHRRRVVAWDTFSRPTPFSAPAANAESQNNWLAHRLKAFLKSHRIRKINAVTSVPLRSSLLREVQLPSIDKEYVEGIIASELEETIPFAKEEVDIAWRVGDLNELNVANAVIVPKSITDESVAKVKETNIELSAIFSEAEAMAHAAGDLDALVVRLADRHASMALVMDGSPQMLHRVQYDPASLDHPEQLDSVITSLEQLASNSGRPRNGVRRMKSLSVVLMGAEEDVASLRRSLASHFPADALPNSPHVELPKEFPQAEYGINLGLAVALDSKIKTGMFSRVELGLNLLQERHIPKRMPIRSGAAVAALFVLIGLAITATFEVQDIEAAESALSTRVTAMERQFQLRSGRADKIYADAESARGFNQQLSGALAQLRTETELLLDRILAVTNTARARGMNVPKLSPEGREYVVAGSGMSFDDVFDYAADLRKTGLFDDVLVLRLDSVEAVGFTTPTGIGSVLFQVKVLVSIEGSILQDSESDSALNIVDLAKSIAE